jgi:hypothetical protein
MQDRSDEFHHNPEWRDHFDYIPSDDDSLHGELPGEQIAKFHSMEENSDCETLSASTLSKFKRTIREKLQRANSADSSLSALGTTIEAAFDSNTSDTKPKRNRRLTIKKGTTSISLVHIGIVSVRA